MHIIHVKQVKNIHEQIGDLENDLSLIVSYKQSVVLHDKFQTRFEDPLQLSIPPFADLP